MAKENKTPIDRLWRAKAAELAPSEEPRPMAFIENKQPDMALVSEILQLSEAHNHWANFGPVSRVLEACIHDIAGAGDGQAAVMCRSATAALYALTGLAELKAGRPLRWVVSAFGFFTTRIGPLAGARVVDSDPHGLIDLEALAALEPDSWDGVVVTNPFGLRPEIDEILDFCRNAGKVVLVDNAVALHWPGRRKGGYFGEIISFHQTKPWGMGEGGAAILPATEATNLRKLLNFGIGLGETARLHASNGKISDFDCALILSRLTAIPDWEPAYAKQAERMTRLGRRAGLTPLGLPPRLSGHVPMQAKLPVAVPHLDNPHLVFGKYYPPLAPNCPNASRLFEQMINIPCHTQLAKLPDKTILAALDGVLAAASGN